MATEADKVNTGALATLVAVGTFAMIGISLALVALVRDELSVEANEKDVAADAQYRELQRSQLQSLEQGVPIEAAMQRVVRDIAANPHAATAAGSSDASTGGATSGTALAAGGTSGTTPSTSGGAGSANVAPNDSSDGTAPKPNRVKDGKLPADGAPVPAPGTPSQLPGKAPSNPPKTPAPPATGAAPGPSPGTTTSEHGQ
ncbi:MAG TPA: hypothetical protein VIM73_13745 [Polyangiaceae bacterium]